MPKGKNAAALFEVIGRGTGAAPTESATRTPSWWWKRPASAASSAPDGSAQPMMSVDHDRQLIQFALSTTTSIVIAFGVLVLIILSFIVGEHVGRNRAPMTAITSEALMKSSANPQVLQVPAGSGSPVDHSESAAPDDQSAQQPTQDQTQSTPTPPTSADRQKGMNYVIMQSYPPDMRSLATEAQTALLLHGVPCTIEPAPPHWHPGKNWISVIGTTGFPTITSSDFHAYVRRIDQANADLHGKFKKLQPYAYKWR